MTYQSMIREIVPEHDPRHVEAYMRLEFHTLDMLSPRRFREEAGYAALCVKEDLQRAEELAESFGL